MDICVHSMMFLPPILTLKAIGLSLLPRHVGQVRSVMYEPYHSLLMALVVS